MTKAAHPSASAELLLSDPILGQLSGMRIAALLAHVQHRSVSAGTELFEAKDPAEMIYRVVKGRVRLEDRRALKTPRLAIVSEGFIGEEALLGSDTRCLRATVVDDAELLALPADVLRDIVDEDKTLRERFFNAYAQRFAPDPEDGTDEATEGSVETETTDSLSGVLGWIAAIALPTLIYAGGPSLGLTSGGTDFLAIIAATVCMWLFSLVPEYVPPLFASLAVILLDVAPPEMALSGFRSESFFMCLSVFGLGALMVSSGLTYRLSLWVLGKMPANQFGTNASLFGLGTLLSPILPSVVGRVSIIAPFLIELVEMSKAGAKDLYANRLIYSLLGGSALLVPIFLTASVPNLVIYGLLDPQTQFAFDWMSWLWAASAYGVIVALAFVLVSGVFFRGAQGFSISPEILREQRRVLGPLSLNEWLAIVAVITMGVGVMTEAIHRVDFPWVALAIFVTLLLFGSLKRDAFRAEIDWPVLVYIGAIVGWVPIGQATGLDTFVIAHLSFLGTHMQDNLPLFVAMVSAVILLVRLALPTGVTVVLFATALFPVAAAQGVSLWIIGFVILAVADTFIFPYQSSYYLKLRNDLTDRGLGDVCDERRLVLANITLILARICALYLCLLFWTELDLI